MVKLVFIFLCLLVVLSACSSEKKEPEARREASTESHTEPAKAPPSPAKVHADKEGEGEAPHGHDEATGPVVPLTATERENIGLKTVAAALRPLEDVRRIPGEIKPHPDRIALVTSRTPGKIVDIHAKIGERVKKGQDVIEVQSLEVEKLELDLIQTENKYRAERSKLELDLTQAENKARLAEAGTLRNRLLVEKGIGARKELIAAENQLQAVKNEIAGVKRQMELLAEASHNEVSGIIRQLGLLGLPEDLIARVRREKIVTVLHIPAPLEGVIVERPVSLGQIIDTSTTLFKITDDSVVIAEGDAFENLLPELRVGQHVRLTTTAYPGRVFQGTVTFIHPVIDPEKRMAHIWAQVSNPDHQLKQNMFVQLNVVVGGGGRDAVTIPAEAVIAAEGQEFVFVDKDGGFARMSIATGARNDQFVEVKHGLKAGEKVVTDGKRQVYTKMLTMQRGGVAMGGHAH